MGYRLYLNRLHKKIYSEYSKLDYEEAKSIFEDDVYQPPGFERIIQIGLNVDNEYRTDLWPNKEENDIWMTNEQGLENLIKKYGEEVIKFYEKVHDEAKNDSERFLSLFPIRFNPPFYRDIFDLKMYLKEKHSPVITQTSTFEGDLVNLVNIYRTFDFRNYIPFILGW